MLRLAMIQRFKHKGLRRLFQQGDVEEGDVYDVDLIDYH